MNSQQPPSLPSDSVRAVLDEIFQGPQYVWADAPPNFIDWLRTRLTAVSDWLNALLVDHPVLYWALLATLLLLLAGILGHFSILVYRSLQGPRASDAIAAAPPMVSRDARWYLQRSHELRGRGQFADAIAHRFMSLLMELDRVHIVTYHPAKTPAEYAREVPATDPGRARFGTMVEELYRCLFGGSACTDDTWTAFDGLARDVQRLYAPH